MSQSQKRVEQKARQPRRRGGAPKGNLNRQTHGGSAGLARLHDGKPFTGLAAEAERAVTKELETQGAAAILRRATIRTQAVADLFYNAIVAATEAHDLEQLDRFTQRFGWLQATAARLWIEIAKNERDVPSVTAQTILESVKHERDNDSD